MHGHGAFDQVVDVGELPLHLAAVKGVNGWTFGDDRGEIAKTTCQAGSGGRIGSCNRGPSVRWAFLAGSVEAERVVHGVALGQRHTRIGTVDGAALGIHEMLGAIASTAFNEVAKADQSFLSANLRILQ